ncbi:MAG: TRAM domain-containing protein [Treponema sp.]|nr:TRAM domain-containing protein [Treponema sp.]
MTVGEIYNLRLESITAGGDALGRFDGKPVFITGGAPDETVLCRIKEDRKTWARAELLEIIKPSPVRTDSFCEHYGKCGGCNLQHIKYNSQLEIKTSILKDSFSRIGKLQPPEPEIIPSPSREYRNRMQFHCLRQKAKGDNYLFGLKEQGSGDITVIHDCPVAVPGIREILNPSSISASSASCEPEIRDLCGKKITIPPDKDRFTVFSKDDVLLNEGGQQRGIITLLDKEITLDAGVFFQSNCFMLEKLINELINTATRADRNLPMADLYCGVGTFALFLGGMFPKIILAEENKNAVSLARENLKELNAEYFALRDTEWPRIIFNKKNNLGFAVIDPPRSGLNPKLASALTLDGPPVLTYVSCDPASLARDSTILTAGGYKLIKLLLFDFYPQTSHIESLAVFEK